MSLSRSVSIALRSAAMAAGTVLAGASAHATSAEDAERTALAQERAAIDSTYSARLEQCRQRFVVTSCVEDAKRDRRHGLDDLHLRQIKLDESRRRERSAARRAELSAHAAEAARRDADQATRPANAASRAAPVPEKPERAGEPRRSTVKHPPAAKGRTAPASAGASGAASAGAAARAVDEARSRASFEARQTEAAEHRENVLEKAAERARQHRPAAPLPIPKDIKTAP